MTKGVYIYNKKKFELHSQSSSREGGRKGEGVVYMGLSS